MPTTANTSSTFDIGPGGERFLFLREAATADNADGSARFIVVQNWFEELRRLVPTN